MGISTPNKLNCSECGAEIPHHPRCRFITQGHCKLGLWCISGEDRQRVELEAKHYWRQCMADGEYAQLLD